MALNAQPKDRVHVRMFDKLDIFLFIYCIGQFVYRLWLLFLHILLLLILHTPKYILQIMITLNDTADKSDE